MQESLPSAGSAREKLREKGQFFTPGWVADAMVAFAGPGSKRLYDPGFGLGAFALAAERVFGEQMPIHAGCDIDPSIWERALASGIRPEILKRVERRDFFAVSRLDPETSIVANPPYIRHHRIDVSRKQELQALATRHLGHSLDGRTGLHAFFLIHALALLPPNRRLAFIVPADICEGIYAQSLWRWITARFRLHAMITFAPDATPFPGVDTNALVLMLSNETPQATYVIARVHRGEERELRRWIEAGMPNGGCADLVTQERHIADGVKAGMSRFLLSGMGDDTMLLGSVIRTMRGIATGANDFFFLNSSQVRALGLPRECFVRAIGRTRDVSGAVVTREHLDTLDREGRPTFLLSLHGTPSEELPESVRAYLQEGTKRRLDERALIRMRGVWYKMERRTPPPFLFAYLGRRNTRFLRNDAGAVPLTSFLCVYNRHEGRVGTDRIALLLEDPGVIEAMPYVAKSYGGGAIKLEPRSLERVPILPEVVERHPWLRDLRKTAQTALAL